MLASYLFGILILSALILISTIQTVDADDKANEKIEVFDKRINDLHDDFFSGINLRSFNQICLNDFKFYVSHGEIPTTDCRSIAFNFFPVLQEINEETTQPKKTLISNFQSIKLFMKVIFLEDVNSIKAVKTIDAMEFCLHPEGLPGRTPVPFEECEIEIDYSTNTNVKKIRGWNQLERQLDLVESKVDIIHKVHDKRWIIVDNNFGDLLGKHPCPELCFTPL